MVLRPRRPSSRHPRLDDSDSQRDGVPDQRRLAEHDTHAQRNADTHAYADNYADTYADTYGDADGGGGGGRSDPDGHAVGTAPSLWV